MLIDARKWGKLIHIARELVDLSDDDLTLAIEPDVTEWHLIIASTLGDARNALVDSNCDEFLMLRGRHDPKYGKFYAEHLFLTPKSKP